MKFFTALAALPLLAFAAASPIEAEVADILAVRATDNSKAVEKGIANIKNDTIQLNNTLNTIPPTAQTIDFGTLITLLGQSNQIASDLTSTSTAVNSSAPFNGADAIQIGIANIDLVNTVTSLLNNFQYRVKAFKNQGVQQIVAQQLAGQKEQTREFANGLSPKLGVLGQFSPFIVQPLYQKFDQTIALYNTTS